MNKVTIITTELLNQFRGKSIPPGRYRAFKYLKIDLKSRGKFKLRAPLYSKEYKIGRFHSVKNLSTEPMYSCARGINLASLGWCRFEVTNGFQFVYAAFEFTVPRVKCIVPIHTNGKFRVSGAKFVGVVNGHGKDQSKEWLKERVNSYRKALL